MVLMQGSDAVSQPVHAWYDVDKWWRRTPLIWLAGVADSAIPPVPHKAC